MRFYPKADYVPITACAEVFYSSYSFYKQFHLLFMKERHIVLFLYPFMDRFFNGAERPGNTILRHFIGSLINNAVCLLFSGVFEQNGGNISHVETFQLLGGKCGQAMSVLFHSTCLLHGTKHYLALPPRTPIPETPSVNVAHTVVN